MKATLLVLSDNTIKRRVALKLACVLGRSREADVIVAHPLISRRHCELSEADGLLMLRDLVSLNGTMIGGRRITSAPLLPGAEFTIGPLTFRVQYEYDGDLESLPPTCFADEAGAVVEAMPAAASSLSESEDTERPDFMAWMDADAEDVAPAILLDPEESEGPPSLFPQPAWPQVGPAGERRGESPWASESPQTEPPKQPSAKDTPAVNQPPPLNWLPIPTQAPSHEDEIDPDAPSFLEGLR